MPKDRMAAFSDGVIAILITIMVLEIRAPESSHLSALRPMASVFLIYLLSFVNLGIYWNNHHHLLQVTERVNGTALWANLHLLFWLSLFPFGTEWLGHHVGDAVPAAAYGVILLGAAIAYYLLQCTLIAVQRPDTTLADAIGRDLKGKVSPLIYGAGILLALLSSWISIAAYVVVSLIWLVPDRRLESRLDAASRARS